MGQSIHTMTDFIQQAKQCAICQHKLPNSAKPIFQGSTTANILIIGQAPGIKAHQTGIPWNDASGERLRQWLKITPPDFYDETKVAILPMGFCYPGKGKTGDLPPMKECAPTWHPKLIGQMDVKVTLLIGQYAQQYYLEDNKNLTERVQSWRDYQPEYLVLPHPSPRNNIWLKKNPWFEQQLLPDMRKAIAGVLR